LSLDAFLDIIHILTPSFRQTNQRIRGQRELLQEEIKKDQKNKTIKESEQIEKYAREILYEKKIVIIHIIEFEGDID
jgi:cell division septum initiation protein DivIVA